jgi:hypothetical protein
MNSRKVLGQHNYLENDAKVEAGGRYIGFLPSKETADVRQWHNILKVKKEQIDELIEDFEMSHNQYLQDISSIFHYLKIDTESINTTTEKLSVSEDGHMWAVKCQEND